MLEHLETLPPDPILGLMAQFRDDPRAEKVDLGVGVYKDEAGNTPILTAIKEAERRLLVTEHTKAYIGPAGNEQFNELMSRLLLGDASGLADGRVAAVQTPGGCGALRVLAELMKVADKNATIWVSDPTWGNHVPLLSSCGLRLQSYPYYDPQTGSVNFSAMMNTLEQVPEGDLVLLHGCCHNPSGADLSIEQWRAVADLAALRGFTPFVDVAYQGFGDGVDDDVAGLRHLIDQLPEVIVAASCSKNFGLYRERVGLAMVVGRNTGSVRAAKSHMLSIIRGIYSMPPNHGAALVAEVLGDDDLRSQWLQELGVMRKRIVDLRIGFSDAMAQRLGSDRFRFVQAQKGMFSFLGLPPEQVTDLRDRFAIYMLESSRTSIAGLSQTNLDAVCDAVCSVINAAKG